MKFWSECTEKLEAKLSQEEFNTWIKPLKADINENNLEISAPNDFVLTYVKENLGQIIESLVNKSDDSLIVKFKTLDKSTFVEKLNVSEQNKPGLVQNFTFNTFVEGKSNHMALAAAKQVAANPKGDYNPLFIYGGVGLGKTHLMHAVGNEILNADTSKRIVYVHSEKFVADMVKALQLGAMSEFKEFYRNADALLIDDIQFFAGKEQSQEEFFHTFNTLLDRNHQMVLTCDKYPKEIDGLEERLKSRLGWGLPVIIEPPELETRAAVLLSKANSMGVKLPNDCAFYIAQRIRSNIRELEGALKRVVANSRFTDQEIDYCRGRFPQIAARFASKEAVMKALGTGIRGVPWKSIEVYRPRGKAPQIRLYGNAKRKAEELGIKEIAISISHSRNYAVASVVAQ